MIYWVLVVAWLYNGDDLSTPDGTWLEAREEFLTETACGEAISRYEGYVVRDFDTKGVVLCYPVKKSES